jgi:HSP20 family molecular chaperone IbpA
MNNLVKQENQSPATTSQTPERYYVAPLVQIEPTQEGYLLRAEMPGVGKDGAEVTVENGELVILGHRQKVQAPGQLVYSERRPFDYRRSYELDASIDTSKISAKVENGVLTVTLPKAESVKPRKITLD